MIRLKKYIKSAARKGGYDISRYCPENSIHATLMRLFSAKGIDLVIDVGANSGQFGMELIEHGYRGKIVSFEPLSEAYGQLKKRSRGFKKWIIAERCAIGDINGKLDINISKNLVSSSILTILDTHINVEPKAEYIGKEQVEICKLEDVAYRYIDVVQNGFLKIDVQGYEDRVLKGSLKIMNGIQGIQIEVSLVPLYAEQAGFIQLISFVQNLGYGLFAIFPGFADNNEGRMYQVDCIFLRNIR